MAFPQIVGVVATNGTVASATPAVSLPQGSDPQFGDLLVVQFRTALAGTVVWPDNWTVLANVTGDPVGQFSVACVTSDLTEGSSITLASGGGKFVAVAWRITGAASTAVKLPVLSKVASGDGVAPNPGISNPALGFKDYLWLWVGGWMGIIDVPAFAIDAPIVPFYTLGMASASTGVDGIESTNCRIFGAGRHLNAEQEDGPAIGVVTDSWIAFTIAISPVVVGDKTQPTSPPVVQNDPTDPYSAVSSVLSRLDDEDATVWSYDEILLYIEDGYNRLCRQTKCLFDIHVIENVPPTGNWSSDLERYLAEHTQGMGLTDDPLHFTAEHERDTLIGGSRGSTEGPAPGTSPADSYADFNVPVKVSSGRLPDETVEVIRTTWDQLELFPEDSGMMRRRDVRYEIREGGDPQNFTMDKDGLLTIRITPPARGDAEYDTVDGSWGTMTEETGADDTATVVGTWGILREVEGAFPAGGPHGTPTRMHPHAKNIFVEILRMGRPLKSFSFEIPRSFVKFVIFWALYRALKRTGPGQDIKLAQHYSDRFDMGVSRLQHRLKRILKEQVLRMGAGTELQEPFGLGDPKLPYPYGSGRKI